MSEKIEKVLNKIGHFYENKYVYILRCQDFYKIGITSNINNRVHGVQGGNPYQIEIVYALRCKNFKVLEETLHNIFSLNKERGEWFRLNDKELSVIIEAIRTYGNKSYN